jgi:phosphoglycolate phosphatase
MEKILKNLKLLIFDFDYTLFDTSEGVIYCMREALLRKGFSDVDGERIKNGIGLSLKEFFSQYTDDVKIIKEMEDIFLENSKQYMVEKTFPMKNTVRVINELHDRRFLLSIYTGKYIDRVSRTLNNYSLYEKFDPIVCGDKIKNKKPDPEGLMKCIEHHKDLNRSTIAYIGDHYYDIVTAQRCGIESIAVTSGNTQRAKLMEYNPTHIISDLIELLDGD